MFQGITKAQANASDMKKKERREYDTGSLPIFFLCGGLKIVYDLVLWREFRRIKPPEEL